MNNIRKYAIWAHQELIGKIQKRAQTLGGMISVNAENIARHVFIRICALRFMEINGYLPNQMRIFSDQNQRFRLQVLLDYCECIESDVNLHSASQKALKDNVVVTRVTSSSRLVVH